MDKTKRKFIKPEIKIFDLGNIDIICSSGSYDLPDDHMSVEQADISNDNTTK